MNFKSLIALLAIFVVIMSASAVCAVDDDGGVTPSDADDETPAEDETTDDETEDDSDVVDDDLEYGNDTIALLLAAGEDNDTEGASGSSETPLSSNTAGNPVLVLLAALAVLGIVPLKRK